MVLDDLLSESDKRFLLEAGNVIKYGHMFVRSHFASRARVAELTLKMECIVNRTSQRSEGNHCDSQLPSGLEENDFSSEMVQLLVENPR